MKTEDKQDLLDQIAIADIGQLRQIIARLEGMECSYDVVELIDIAEENVYAISGSFGDY